MTFKQDWNITAERHMARQPGMLQIITLVLWLACLFVGLLGMWLQSTAVKEHPKIAPITELAPQPELIDVDMTEPPPEDAPPLQQQAETIASADVPPLPTVAAPSPAIAFAVPVEGPVRVASGSYASLSRATPMARPKVQRLTYGVGEGKQPKPDYPFEAAAAGETGIVGVEFTVGEDGNVTSVRASKPSIWPLLNVASTSKILQEWHFPPGPRRVYIIFFTFKGNET